MLYNPVKVDVPSRFHDKIKKALENYKGKKVISVQINLAVDGGDTLLLTSGQIKKMERLRLIGKKKITIHMSRNQIKANLKHEGGFIGMLMAALSAALPSIISAVTAAAPAVLASAATGAISGAVAKAVGGDGMYFKKNGHCVKVEPVCGGGLYLSPYPMVEQQGDGLYLRHNGKLHREIGSNHSIKEKLPMLGLLL